MCLVLWCDEAIAGSCVLGVETLCIPVGGCACAAGDRQDWVYHGN